MPIKLVHIAVVGNEELVSGLRLAGVSKYYMIKGDGDVGEDSSACIRIGVSRVGQTDVEAIADRDRSFVQDRPIY